MKISATIKDNSLPLDVIEQMSEYFKKNNDKLISIELKEDRSRTTLQNNALHLYCKWIADYFNQIGVPLTVTIRRKIERQWNMHDVKYNIIHPIMNQVYKKTSTAQLTKKELIEIAKIVEDWIREDYGDILHFPSEDELRKRSLVIW